MSSLGQLGLLTVDIPGHVISAIATGKYAGVVWQKKVSDRVEGGPCLCRVGQLLVVCVLDSIFFDTRII